MRLWHAENKEHRSKTFKAWAEKNPDKINALSSKRNAAKLQAVPLWVDFDAIEKFYEEALRLTAETGIRHEVDHIYPLQGEWVCGLHVAENLQILTKTENLRKHNRMPDELDLRGAQRSA